ncbi:MAG: VPS10 domain-containing protein [Terriglobia bacterium]
MNRDTITHRAFTAIVLSFTFVGTLMLSGAILKADSASADVFHNLKFRDLGPGTAGGRVTAIVGIAGNLEIYYVGTAGGGVFKTIDGGLQWKAIFEHEATGSIGALALDPSNSSTIWAGTGEANIRNDLIDGHGVYVSHDAGHSWKFIGLGDAGQISDIAVDPRNPNEVFVGVLGHAWAPNTDRGVFRTTDGGKTWQKVLYVDDTTGVANLVMQPGNPNVLYAAMWQFRRYPWTLNNGGPGSGIYRSADGGDTWKKLTEGLPAGPYGRIALAVAPTNPNHLYALIDAKKGMLWQSMDMGDHWTAVSNNHGLDVRPFYFSRILVSPANENKIYTLSFNLMESDDGGKTARAIDRHVHPDHHALWIDPKNPDRMIQGNDGGVFLSTDGGKTWRFLDGLPIEQFYQVAADSRSPYNLCGGLQDNNSWCGPSSDIGGRSDSSLRWYTVVGGDGEYAVPAPSDPNIIYTDSQDGFIERLDLTTHLSRFVRPSVDSVEEMKPSALKYRFNWTSPIAVSPTDANTVYLGANVLFKSTDGGQHWTAISDDLTRNDKSKQPVAGEPISHDVSGAETYDTILSITLAPTDPKVIWVGTDDGLVQVTRDGGKHWTNVTSQIPGAPAWAMVYQLGVSPFDAGTAYAAFDGHKLDDHKPYVYRTSDYGQTWQKITTGLPGDEPIHVVREDPNQKGLLVAGSDTGLFYSTDDGNQWAFLKANFPTTAVYDLKFIKSTHDLVVATHGRGIFVLDDIRPVEEYSASLASSGFHLFTPGAGVLYHHWQRDEGQQNSYTAPNAPSGVVIDYYLKSKLEPTPDEKKNHQSPVKIVITDAKGQTVATQYGPSKAGVNRAIWTMHYEGPSRLSFVPAPPPNEFFNPNQGPTAIPGDYHVTLTVNGRSQTAAIAILPDPNLNIDPSVFRAQLKAALLARNEVSAMNKMLNRLDGMKKEISSFRATVDKSADAVAKKKYAALLNQGKGLDQKLSGLEDQVFNTQVQRRAPEDSIHYLERLHSQLAGSARRVGRTYGQAPNELMQAKLDELRKELDQRLSDYNSLLKGPIAAYNKAAYAEGAPTLYGGGPISVQPPPSM